MHCSNVHAGEWSSGARGRPPKNRGRQTTGGYAMLLVGLCHLGRNLSSSSVTISSVTATLSSIAVGFEVTWDICTHSFSKVVVGGRIRCKRGAYGHAGSVARGFCVPVGEPGRAACGGREAGHGEELARVKSASPILISIRYRAMSWTLLTLQGIRSRRLERVRHG